MTNLKVVIVDEERLARVNLRRMLGHFPEIEIAGEADTCESAAKLINMNNPHLVFLDIQLRGETGLDLLKLIDNSIKVIFVTAFDEKALRAFEVNTFNYLSKPVNPVKLRGAIEMVIKLLKQHEKQSEELFVF